MNLNWGGGYTKSEVDTLLNGKADTSHTHTKSQITDFPSYGTTANTICEGNDSRLSDARTPTSHTHIKSEITDFPTLATVATSGSYNDLSDKPSIPTVNNATLTIQKNGTNVKTFTANASSDVTCNITVPTKTSDLTNDSGFLTSHQSLSNYSTLANTIKSLSISGKTITYTKGDNTTGTLTTQDNNTWTAMVGATSSSNGSVGYVNAVPPKDGYNTKYLRADGTWQVPPDHTYTVNNATLTIQKNGTTVKTFTANASSNVTCNITVPTKTSDLTNDSGFITADNSKIPLSGTNSLAGSIVPNTNNAYDFGSSSYKLRYIYANTAYVTNLNINGSPAGDILTHNASEFVPRSGGAVITGWLGKTTDSSDFSICGATSYTKGATMWLYGNDNPNYTGGVRIKLTDSNNDEHWFTLYPNGYAGWNGKELAMKEDTVPRSGGAVMTGTTLGRVDNSTYLNLCGGLDWSNGATVSLYGKDLDSNQGVIIIHPNNGTQEKIMWLYPDGTWTWNGTACQITSDQRLKQQITEIDDKLLDAWKDVEPSQFKYNDAVNEKGDNARLHTGYVVQQIDNACKSHGVDVSQYGLYCHEEYPEETEEVEVKQDDGTIKKETKVIREASEHYSLRYTETLVVECAYLRREVSRLKQQNENLELRLKMLEQSVK